MSNPTIMDNAAPTRSLAFTMDHVEPWLWAAKETSLRQATNGLPMECSDKRFISVEDAQQLLQERGIELSLHSMRRLARSKKIPSIKPGRRVYLDKQAVEEYGGENES